MKTPTFVNAQRSTRWLSAFLVFVGLVLAGCGGTAPIVQDVSGPNELETNETGTFEASINEDADEPLTYNWEFGDGSSGTGLLATHAYSSPGTYTVKFRASNDAGADSSTVTVNVVRPPQPARITNISASPTPATEGETVRFSSNVRGDSPITYNWDFGDGNTATGASVTHTYNEPGDFTYSLSVSNNVGNDSSERSLTVKPDLPPICTTVSEFNSSFFGRNSSTLTSEAEGQLQENADILSQCPNLSVRVEGFAAPGERSAQSLSEDRARAVADYYTSNGVPSSRISTTGQGEVGGVTSKKGGTRQFRRADSIPQRSGM